jgi:hypothetical protein
MRPLPEDRERSSEDCTPPPKMCDVNLSIRWNSGFEFGILAAR